jgi:hypothetical protein
LGKLSNGQPGFMTGPGSPAFNVNVTVQAGDPLDLNDVLYVAKFFVV